MDQFPTMACANWKDGGEICPLEGKFACAGCKLVVYCGSDCQKKHWSEHKKQCNSPLRKESWRPSYDREKRQPVQYSRDPSSYPLGAYMGLWGRTPAMDILRLHDNEGQNYNKSISILFAASGDLRNVVKTIRDLNDNLQITIAINDGYSDTTIRNAILLLLVLVSLDEESEKPNIELLAEDMMHIWYSSMLTKHTLSRLQSKVKPLISEVCGGISNKTSCTYLEKLWRFESKCTLRLTLKEKDWVRALTFFEIPEHLTAEKAQELRHAIVLAPEGQDKRENRAFRDVSTSMRVAKQRYEEDGMLLPFGHPRVGFEYPNPTIFQTTHGWPMCPGASPLVGWLIKDVRPTLCRAPEDLYGKLYFYIRNVLCSFIRKLAAGNIHLELSDNDLGELRPSHDEKYDRIEASNMADKDELGTKETLASLAPLLKSPEVNPHATLITIYLLAVRGVNGGDIWKNPEDVITSSPMAHVASHYLKDMVWQLTISGFSQCDHSRFWASYYRLLPAKEYFCHYMATENFPQIAERLGVAIKEKNTIGDQWPTGLKIPREQPGDHKEFAWLLASTYYGCERRAEWKRVR
ncbi:hypothetical protein F4805DRAFT_315199 [Annulohypoxylon moriforme]|nr:hypothetical protein F4805DRAFT_315199 [Annulohypoxylon moriforme]